MRKSFLDRVWALTKRSEQVVATSRLGIAIVQQPAAVDPYFGYVVHGRLGVVVRSLPGVQQLIDDRHLRTLYMGLPPIGRLVWRRRVERLPGLVLSARNAWERNYYHATIECLGAIATFESAGLLEEHTVVVGRHLAESMLWREFTDRGGMDDYTVVVQDREWVNGSGGVAFVELPPGPAMSVDGAGTFDLATVDTAHLARLVRFLERVVPARSASDERRLYVSRGISNGRQLVNDDEVRQLCRRRGFEIVDPGACSWVDQVTMFRNAAVVVGVHGAALTNILYRWPDSMSVVEITDPGWRGPHFQQLAQNLSFQYTTVTGRGRMANGSRPDFFVDLDALDAALDVALGSPSDAIDRAD